MKKFLLICCECLSIRPLDKYFECIVLDKRSIWKIFFLFLYENIHCGYSLEAPRRGASNEYPQCMVSLRNKKIINSFFGWKKKKKCLEKKKKKKMHYLEQ